MSNILGLVNNFGLVERFLGWVSNILGVGKQYFEMVSDFFRLGEWFLR